MLRRTTPSHCQSPWRLSPSTWQFFSEENLDSATIFVAFGFLLPALPAEKCLKNKFIARRAGNFFGERIFLNGCRGEGNVWGQIKLYRWWRGPRTLGCKIRLSCVLCTYKNTVRNLHLHTKNGLTTVWDKAPSSYFGGSPPQADFFLIWGSKTL